MKLFPRCLRWAGPCAIILLAAQTEPVRADTAVGGNITSDTTWSGTILVYSNVTVRSPATLTIEGGTMVRLTNSVGIAANTGGHVDVQGTTEQPVTFTRMNTSFTRWGDLSATGAGATLTIRHALIDRGRVRATSSGTTLVEDSELSQMTSTGIIGGNGGALFTVRRCYVHDYEDIDLVNTRTLAEDSLFERANSDIFELQNSPSGSILRRCTFRTCLNANSDGVDMNGCVNTTIDSCRIYDVTDKGISSGSALSASDPTSFGLVVTNTLIYNADTAIGIKDRGTASLFNNTIATVVNGVRVYQKFTGVGGFVTNGANNLIWDVTTAIRQDNGGTVVTTFSDVQGMSFPGTGNISSHPLWRNATVRDYRLESDSPCLGGGTGGGNIGITYPIGGLPGTPELLRALVTNATNVVLLWSEASGASYYVIQRALNNGSYNSIAAVPGSVTNYTDTVLGAGAFSYIVRATNLVGASFDSNPAVIAISSDDADADGMLDAWEEQNGLDTRVNDASGDKDGDGYTNLQEYLAGTRPNDASSLLRLEIGIEDGETVLSFQRVAGKSYTLQSRSSLSTGSWATLLTIPADPNGGFFSISDPMGGSQQFFRLSVP